MEQSTHTTARVSLGCPWALPTPRHSADTPQSWPRRLCPWQLTVQRDLDTCGLSSWSAQKSDTSLQGQPFTAPIRQVLSLSCPTEEEGNSGPERLHLTTTTSQEVAASRSLGYSLLGWAPGSPGTEVRACLPQSPRLGTRGTCLRERQACPQCEGQSVRAAKCSLGSKCAEVSPSPTA